MTGPRLCSCSVEGQGLERVRLTPEAVLSSGGSMQVKHEGGRYLDPCEVDPPPCWKALGSGVNSGQCPDGVICSADGKQSNFPGPALVAF